VVATGRDEGRLHSVIECLDEGAEALAVPADLTSSGAAKSIVAAALDAFARIDAVVHCAGVFIPASFEETTLDDFRTQWALNVEAPFTLSKEAVSHMAPGSSLIFISSTAGRIGFANTGAYAATKAAIDSFTRVWGIELAAKGIRVNGIAPGWIQTPMNEALREDAAVVESAIAATPAGRLGVPADIAPSVVFLASDDAAFINGVVLDVGGGYPNLPDVIKRN